MVPLLIHEIARVCHEANREYCLTLGDTSQNVWTMSPEWQRDSAIAGVAFHIEHLDRGEDPAPEASHNSWLEQKRADGWTYGPVKDPEKKQHPCFVPYEQLPLEQRRKDYLFAAIVKALYTAK